MAQEKGYEDYEDYADRQFHDWVDREIDRMKEEKAFGGVDNP